MSAAAADGTGTPSTTAASVATPPPPAIEPVDLFGDDAQPNPSDAALVVDDTKMDDSPGWVTNQPYMLVG